MLGRLNKLSKLSVSQLAYKIISVWFWGYLGVYGLSHPSACLGPCLFICRCSDVCRSGNLRWYWRTRQNWNCRWNTSKKAQLVDENGNLKLANCMLSLSRLLTWYQSRRLVTLMHSAECKWWVGLFISWVALLSVMDFSHCKFYFDISFRNFAWISK